MAARRTGSDDDVQMQLARDDGGAKKMGMEQMNGERVDIGMVEHENGMVSFTFQRN